MSTATIEKGSEVETVIKGDVTGQDSAGRNIVMTPEGVTVVVPKNAYTVVTKKPLPKEPKAGSYVQYSYAIFCRDAYKGWYRLDQKESDRYGDRKYHTWAELNDAYGRGNLTRLVQDRTVTAAELAGTKFGNSYGDKVSAKVNSDIYGGDSVTVSVNDGCYSTVPNDQARRFAWAILKATGGA